MMHTNRRRLALALALIAASATGLAAADVTAAESAAATTPEPVTVKITVSNRGYEPKRVEVPEGVPLRLELTRKTEDECVGTFQSDALGVAATILSTEKPTVIELPAQKAGEYAFACPMAMVEGKLVVKPAGS
jgi:plastocyanin domain-containing protein